MKRPTILLADLPASAHCQCEQRFGFCFVFQRYEMKEMMMDGTNANDEVMMERDEEKI